MNTRFSPVLKTCIVIGVNSGVFFHLHMQNQIMDNPNWLLTSEMKQHSLVDNFNLEQHVVVWINLDKNLVILLVALIILYLLG